MTKNRLRAGLVLLATVLTASLLHPSAAHAHDVLVHTDPAHNQILETAPASITLTYNNEIIDLPGANVVELRDSSDNTVVASAPTIVGTTVTQNLDSIPDIPGVYRVVWRVVSSDGHPIEGSFNFGVGAVTEAELAKLPAPISAAANALPLSPEFAASQEQIAVTAGAISSSTAAGLQDQSNQQNSFATAAWAVPLGITAAITAALLVIIILKRKSKGLKNV